MVAHRRTTMTTNAKTNRVLTDTELDAVIGGYSWEQLKSDVINVVETVLGQSIHSDDRPPCVGPTPRR
jgi:hypothetical protein